MREFIDTSALLAILDRRADLNGSAVAHVERLRSSGVTLLSHNYVLLESAALVTRRLGASSVVDLLADLVPVIDDIVWIDRAIHASAVAALLRAPSRSLSLVDLVSFEVMRREGVDTAFAFDDDFVKAGFRVVP